MSLPPDAVRVRAHAKVNLDLRVLGVRPDGFHELRTVFQSLALHDTLTLTRRAGPFRIECDAPGVPLDRSNLVWLAAERLWRTLGRDGRLRDIEVRLQKAIPPAAGLGGGSADAAAMLRALLRLWDVRLRRAEMASVAAGLGSDVPFFLHGGTAVGIGRGDEIAALADMPRYGVVLLVPRFGVSSPDAYRWYDALAGRRRRPARPPGPWRPRATQLVNDLEPAVARHHAEIGRMKAALGRAGARAAAMSGSGSTVFGLFADEARARAAAGRLAGRGWQVVATVLLDRAAYARRARPVALRPPGDAAALPRHARLG